ncbi:hypothetical protein [Methanosarcina mazei]|nr:hypothetical protein [Methanosarcina mazei]BBL63974.1 hypothetical protein MmazTMA_09510 [Methanosarcina mazei]
MKENNRNGLLIAGSETSKSYNNNNNNNNNNGNIYKYFDGCESIVRR